MDKKGDKKFANLILITHFYSITLIYGCDNTCIFTTQQWTNEFDLVWSVWWNEFGLHNEISLLNKLALECGTVERWSYFGKLSYIFNNFKTRFFILFLATKKIPALPLLLSSLKAIPNPIYIYFPMLSSAMWNLNLFSIWINEIEHRRSQYIDKGLYTYIFYSV